MLIRSGILVFAIHFLPFWGGAQSFSIVDHLNLGREDATTIFFTRAIVSAPDNEAYAVGFFIDTLIIAPDTLQSSESEAVYVVRVDNSLNPTWVKKIAENRITVSGVPMRASTASDVAGNLLVGISYTDVLFYSGDSTGSPGEVGIRLLKLNPTGDTLWTRGIEGDFMWPNGIAADSMGDYLLTGIDNEEVFVSKYSGSGELVWRRTAGVAGGYNQGTAVTTDAFGAVYVTGTIGPLGTAHFDDLSVSLPGGAYNVSFLAKYNTEGSIQWVRYVYSNLWAEATVFENLVCTSNGDVVLAGTYSDSMLRFSNGYPAVGPQFGGEAQWFLTAFSPDGERLWVTVPPYWEQGESFARDIQLWDSNILMLSEFTGNAWSADGNLSSYGSKDMRLQVFDNAGSMVSDLQMGGSSLDIAGNLLVSGSDLFLVGATGSHPFNVGADSFDHPDPGNAFVIKLAQDPNGLPSVAANQSFSAYPNPSNGNVRLSIDPRLGRCRVVVRDAMGRVVLERSVSAPTETIRVPESGLYLLELTGADGRLEAQRLIVE